ncbi:MAG: ATP-binding protein [Candidatus Thorarchaeota archaeon]
MKLRTRLLITLIVATIPLNAVLVVTQLSISTENQTNQIVSHLSSVAAIKEGNVERILDRWHERLASIIDRGLIPQMLSDYVASPNQTLSDDMNAILKENTVSRATFVGVDILSTAGIIVSSSSNSRVGLNLSDTPEFKEGLLNYVFDTFHFHVNSTLHTYLSGPIYNQSILVGVGIIDLDTEELVELFSDYTGLGDTGESLLAMRDENGDALFITQLRFDSTSSLNRTLSKEDTIAPSTVALSGIETVVENAPDYRNHSVLAVTKYIDHRGVAWGLVVKIDNDEVFAPVAEFIQTSTILFALVFISAIILSIYLSQMTTEPIEKLTQVTESISSGDWSLRAETPASDELASLANSINEMTDSLVVSNEELQERIKQLQATQEQLIQSERLAVLGKLSGGIGHDLRNPLGTIKNSVYYLRMVLENPDEEIIESLDLLDQEIKTCELIINSLLDFASPKAPIRQKINLNELISATLARANIPESIKLETDLDTELPVIFADPTQLSRVFINLIRNAVQAMEKGGKLSINIETVEPGYISITITDTGSGITEENLQNIFTPLFTTKAKGIGLGLAISKTFIESHDGTIDVKSIVDKGTSFEIRIPVGGTIDG